MEEFENEDFIKIYLRMKPGSNSFIYGDEWIEIPEYKSKLPNKKYTFSKVFDEKCSQGKIFDEIAFPILKQCLSKHKNCLLFSYGITNSGKTYTILGTKENPGLFLKTAKRLISMTNKNSCIYLEIIEIYNEDVIDLLSINSETPQKNISRIKLDSSNIIEIQNLIETLRMRTDNGLNSTSSRSHLLLKFYFNNIVICLVDLAGSERTKKIFQTGREALMPETCSINKSLLVLGRCIRALIDQTQTQNQRSIIPFRDSKLTHMISEFFSKDNFVRIIANISSRFEDLEETSRVLEYTSLAANIKPIEIHRTPKTKNHQLKIIAQYGKIKSEMDSKMLYYDLTQKCSLFSQEWKDFIFNSRNELEQHNQDIKMFAIMMFESFEENFSNDFTNIGINTSPIKKETSNKECFVRTSCFDQNKEIVELKKEKEKDNLDETEEQILKEKDKNQTNGAQIVGNNIQIQKKDVKRSPNDQIRKTPIQNRLRSKYKKHVCN